MPNTLIHIAIQTPASRALFPKIELPWLLLGTIIPDVPWIVQRILFSTHIADPQQIRLYCTPQASLLFCLLLSFAIASLYPKPLRLFPILAGNSLVHLLLDALQIKWGNGVHLLAPFSWQTLSFGLVWPENIAGYLLSLLGCVYLALKLQTIYSEGITFHIRPPWRWCTLCLVLYLLLPFAVMKTLESSNTNFIQTVKQDPARIGKTIELDRTYFSALDSSIKLYTGETVAAAGMLPKKSGLVSFKGEFTGLKKLNCKEFHSHNSFRDYASKLGILVILAIWSHLLLNQYFKLIPRWKTT